jgi:hypothetical protein
MPARAKLREDARHFRQAALNETEPHLRGRLVNHALALTLLAEQIERERRARPDYQRRQKASDE